MMTGNEASILAKHISFFLNEYVPARKTGSANTLKAYQDTIGLYLQFLEQRGTNCKSLAASCFGKDRIGEWLGWLRTERGNQPETRNNRLAVKALLAAPDQTSCMGRRDLTLMLMLYSTAARIDEILSMKVGQLHLDGAKPYAEVIGKGNKVRTLYLLPRTTAHLKKYLLEFHGQSPAAEAYLFYSRNVGIYGKLTAAAADKMLKKHAGKAHRECVDVPLGLHAHQLRHAKASHWLEDGINIVQISFLLGHEQIQTTMVYLDITTEEETKVLATLEGDNDPKTEKKWKTADGSLREFCDLPGRKG